jgi:hypothetical protein
MFRTFYFICLIDEGANFYFFIYSVGCIHRYSYSADIVIFRILDNVEHIDEDTMDREGRFAHSQSLFTHVIEKGASQ